MSSEPAGQLGRGERVGVHFRRAKEGNQDARVKIAELEDAGNADAIAWLNYWARHGCAEARDRVVARIAMKAATLREKQMVLRWADERHPGACGLLMRWAAAGDESAWKFLIRVARRVAIAVLKRMRDRLDVNEADDLASQAVLSLFESMRENKYDHSQAPAYGGFILKTIQYTAWRAVRSNKRHEAAHQQIFRAQINEVLSVADEVARELQLEPAALESELRVLSERQQQVFRLARDGKTTKEISDALGVATGTVSSDRKVVVTHLDRLLHPEQESGRRDDRSSNS